MRPPRASRQIRLPPEQRNDGEHPHVAVSVRRRSASGQHPCPPAPHFEAMAARKPRPAIDERIDRELSRRLGPQQHRFFWCAEAPALGGMTPYEALLAGERAAVLELAMGRPNADTTIRLISTEEGERMRAALGPVRPPYEL